jgi:hypothetical protein
LTAQRPEVRSTSPLHHRIEADRFLAFVRDPTAHINATPQIDRSPADKARQPRPTDNCITSRTSNDVFSAVGSKPRYRLSDFAAT